MENDKTVNRIKQLIEGLDKGTLPEGEREELYNLLLSHAKADKLTDDHERILDKLKKEDKREASLKTETAAITYLEKVEAQYQKQIQMLQAQLNSTQSIKKETDSPTDATNKPGAKTEAPKPKSSNLERAKNSLKTLVERHKKDFVFMRYAGPIGLSEKELRRKLRPLYSELD